MKTTTEIIKDCFKKARMENVPSDRAAYLFKILCDAMNDNFVKREPKQKESILFGEVMGGYSFCMGDFTISCADNVCGYNGSKDIVVSHPYQKNKGFNTIRGAMKYVENNS